MIQKKSKKLFYKSCKTVSCRPLTPSSLSPPPCRCTATMGSLLPATSADVWRESGSALLDSTKSAAAGRTAASIDVLSDLHNRAEREVL